MASPTRHTVTLANAPWLTKEGIDLSRFPIDSVLRQALSPNEQEFRTGCSLLNSMSYGGRAEAGVFLLGLLQLYPHDYGRLTLIVEALGSFPKVATVEALGSELRRVKGSSATRAYLRCVIDTLGRFPIPLAQMQIEELSSDPQVGTRFREHLRKMTLRYMDE